MVYLPTLLYGSESWVMLTKHEIKSTDAEMRYLRKYTVKTKKDRIINKLEEY